MNLIKRQLDKRPLIFAYTSDMSPTIIKKILESKFEKALENMHEA